MPAENPTRNISPPVSGALLEGNVPLLVHWTSTAPALPTMLARHREFEIHLVKRGAGTYYIRDRRIPFRKNSLLLIPPDVTHRFLPQGSTAVEKCTLIFWPAFYGRAAGAFRLSDGIPPVLSMNERETTDVEVLFRSLDYESAARKSYWREVLKLQLRHLFLLIRRLARSQGEGGAGDGRRLDPLVGWCASEIERRFAEDISLQALAQAAGYSLFHLAHLFKRDTGLSVKQYVLQRRIAEARRILLEQPNLTVDAVARQVGFSDFALFNRSFKRLTGQPPTLYRKISHLDRKPC